MVLSRQKQTPPLIPGTATAKVCRSRLHLAVEPFTARDGAIYWLKIGYPTCFRCPRSGVPRRNIAITFMWKNYIVRQKNAPFYFCNNFVKPHCISIIFGTRSHSLSNCNKTASELPTCHLSWWVFLPFLVKLCHYVILFTLDGSDKGLRGHSKKNEATVRKYVK